jgi:hypothetical protein
MAAVVQIITFYLFMRTGNKTDYNMTFYLFAGLCIVVLLTHGRITAATLMQHGVGPLLYMAALRQACRVSNKRPHPPVSLSNYQDIIWNKLYFDHISTIFRTNSPCVLTASGKGHVFADEEPTGKKKRKIYVSITESKGGSKV